MPIGPDHAFAGSPAYPQPKPKSYWAQQKLGWKAPWSAAARREQQIQRVWQNFQQHATLSPRALLGLHAVCINPSKDASRILLSERVVCRGLLRVEAFTDGKIQIDPDVYIGDDCLLSCTHGIKIGSYTLLAHGVQVFDNNTHPTNWQARENHWRSLMGEPIETDFDIDGAPVVIGHHVWVGFNSLILKGVHLGDGCIVAAGSVVTQDVPPYTLVAGAPARVIKALDSPAASVCGTVEKIVAPS